jgi:hypothetical protein
VFTYQSGAVKFTCDEIKDNERELLYEGTPLHFPETFFSFQDKGNPPFAQQRDEIKFNSEIIIICKKIFDTVKEMHDKKIEVRYSSLLVARLYEVFEGYWVDVLLSQNRDRIGIKFWRKVIEITKNWQKDHPEIFIHLGTPYYFLAENYLMVGDLDSAFAYLHEATNIDKKTWQWKYPDHMGSYCLSKLLDKPQSQMNYIVRDLRTELLIFIGIFNERYSDFNIQDFDDKFLRNENELLDMGYFFAYTFFSIVQSKRNAILESSENSFSKLRSLDIIFNLCLIIDEILKNNFLRNETDQNKRTISYSIEKLCIKMNWTNSYQLMKHWENNGKFDLGHMDKIIQMLLLKNENFDGKDIEKEVFTMMLVYVLRNYGAHNLNQHSIVVEKYNEIITELMMALFISVKSIF